MEKGQETGQEKGQEKSREKGQEKSREKSTRSVLRLQDSYLNQARRDNTPVIVQLISGSRLEGRVSGFDSFTVIIEEGGKKHLVYKHAIATMSSAQAKGAKRPSSAGGKGGKPFNSSLSQLGDKLAPADGGSPGDEARRKSGEEQEGQSRD